MVIDFFQGNEQKFDSQVVCGNDFGTMLFGYSSAAAAIGR